MANGKNSAPRNKQRIAAAAAGVVLILVVVGGPKLYHRARYGSGRLHDWTRAAFNRVRNGPSMEAAYAAEAAQTPPSNLTIGITVDPAADQHPISPYIYGMAFAPKDYVSDLRLAVNRWGGNDKTRYNWVQGNASNAARDWNWANRKATDADLPPAPSSAADRFVADNHAGGAATVLTIPTIGWVARDTDNNHKSLGVPYGGAPLGSADGAITGYNPDENRARTSVRSVARKLQAKPGDVAQDEWVRHLRAKFGGSSAAPLIFAMDNEPDLWDMTHTDVHPARMGYDDILREFYDYASAVKDADPGALVTGPVSWGWTGYQYSPLDKGGDNFRTHADSAAHGNQPFLLWFLSEVRKRDAQAHRRTLDILDVHFYPQGENLYSPNVEGDTPARRLRATRALWDKSYKDESWVDEPIRLLPRLHEWVAQGYPDTKIGITEWNFGADNHINGALAIAEVLGIYGREKVYLANYWAYPAKNSPGYLAFKLLRSPDGQGSGLGSVSCRAESTDPDHLSVYAATDGSTGDLTLLLINKMPKTTVTVPVTLSSGAYFFRGSSWLLSGEGTKATLTPGAAPTLQDKILHFVLPPYSATLVRLPKGAK